MKKKSPQGNNRKGKRTTRIGGKRKGKPIRQNRPSWRKVGKKWETVKKQ